MITVDSGAADTVGPPSVARHIPITQTWASLGGFCYTAANGNPLPNKGEKRVTGVTKEGEMVGLTMQVADVTKVLGSVGKFCQANNRVVFDDQEGSYIMNKDTGKQTMLVKSGGVYRFPMWVKKTIGDVQGVQNGKCQDTVKTHNRYEALMGCGTDTGDTSGFSRRYMKRR